MNISIRLSDDESRYIKEQVKISGMSLSAYCRAVLFGNKVSDNLPRQEIGRIMCVYHNIIDDAKTLEISKRAVHEMEKEIWQLIG